MAQAALSTGGKTHWIMIALVGAACVAFWSSEHIPATGGLGYLSDGVVYAGIVRDPAGALQDKYYLHRALPSWTVHAMLSAIRVPLTDANIVGGFLALNSVLLLIAAALWRPIADRLRLSQAARWLGFVGLFWNFALLKMPFYYPIMTDTAAFALGILAVFASLTNRSWLLGAAVLGCTFTWPMGTLLGAPLLLWPRDRTTPPASTERLWLPALLSTGAAAAFLGWFVWLYVVRGQHVRASQFAVPLVPRIVWLGVVGAVAYIVLALRPLLLGVTIRYVASSLRAVSLPGLAMLAAALVPSNVLVAMFGEPRPALDARQFIGNVVFFSSSRPFLFVVANVVYFGPALLLVLSSRVREASVSVIRELGPGWILLMVATVGLSLNSESRQSLFQFPAALILIVSGADRVGIHPRVVWCVGVLGLIMSKFWLPINLDPERMIDTTDPLMPVYYSRYFMNHGPWMSNASYAAQLIAIGVIAVVMCWGMRAPPPPSVDVPS